MMALIFFNRLSHPSLGLEGKRRAQIRFYTSNGYVQTSFVSPT